jgi:hypothetical protein
MSGENDLIAHLVAQGADLAVSRSVRHYVCMPTKEAANSIASGLRNCGHATEVRPAALDSTWLVLATSRRGRVGEKCDVSAPVNGKRCTVMRAARNQTDPVSAHATGSERNMTNASM